MFIRRMNHSAPRNACWIVCSWYSARCFSHDTTHTALRWARVVVLPCCHDVESCDVGPLGGWLDPSLAIDVMRATRLEQRGYRVRTQVIPEAITPKNRLLLGIAEG